LNDTIPEIQLSALEQAQEEIERLKIRIHDLEHSIAILFLHYKNPNGKIVNKGELRVLEALKTNKIIRPIIYHSNGQIDLSFEVLDG